MGGIRNSVRLMLGGLTIWLVAASLTAPVAAATLIVVQADGSATVRSDGGQAITIPAEAVSSLNSQLAGAAEAATVEQVVADIVGQYAATDGVLAGAIAAYALSLVPEALGPAVIAGAQAGNPEAADPIAVAAGPAPDTQARGGLTNLSSVGGVGGGGTQEIRRSASEIR